MSRDSLLCQVLSFSISSRLSSAVAVSLDVAAVSTLCICARCLNPVCMSEPRVSILRLLHRAVESEDATETEALLSAAEQDQAGTGKFFYFSTFVQAALIVHELHLLDIASLRQVCSPYCLQYALL